MPLQPIIYWTHSKAISLMINSDWSPTYINIDINVGCYTSNRIKWAVFLPSNILATASANSGLEEPVCDSDSPVQSCSGPTDVLVKNRSSIKTLYPSSDCNNTIQGYALIISVTISRFLGWFRSLLLSDLFLKPENSNKRLIIDEAMTLFSSTDFSSFSQTFLKNKIIIIYLIITGIIDGIIDARPLNVSVSMPISF